MVVGLHAAQRAGPPGATERVRPAFCVGQYYAVNAACVSVSATGIERAADSASGV